MKILITGGAGFIGSHLAEMFLGKGDEVFVIDDLSTGSIENIEYLKEKKGFHYRIDTIFNVPLTAELVDKCDIIYHLAAAVGVNLIIESPVRTIETNIRGTGLVLELADKKKKKVFVASTSEVYGKGDTLPFREDGDLVFGPTNKSRWSYACSKAIDEFLAIAHWKEKSLPTVVVRLFNTVGPGQTGRYGMVIPRFVKQAVTNQPITVYGDGKQSRCFTHVSDVVETLITLNDVEEAVGEIINIGGDVEITINDLALMVRELAQSSSEIVCIPYDQAYEEGFEDLRRRIPDLNKIKGLIGYNPQHNIKDIILDVINYYKNR
ncbi:MAG: GDP-mannose 4,6-dehydratase [Thermodesulfobacteriota bacterium]